MKVYYAHCQAIYHTPQEQRDINLLQQLGLIVLNPSEDTYSRKVKEIKEGHPDCGRSERVMRYFYDLVDECDVLAFRALPDGRIPAGVVGEIEQARKGNKAIIELPSGMLSRAMSVEQTREYLAEVGQR